MSSPCLVSPDGPTVVVHPFPPPAPCPVIPSAVGGFFQPEGGLPASSPFLPLTEGTCASDKNPFTQRLLQEPGFQPFLQSLTQHSPVPSLVASPSYAGIFWPLGSLGPGEERHKSLEIQSPNDGRVDEGYICVRIYHPGYNDPIHVYFCLCRDNLYNMLYKMINR